MKSIHRSFLRCILLCTSIILSTNAIFCQCSLSIYGPSALCAATNVLDVSINGTCNTAETIHLSVSYSSIPQCNNFNNDCEWTLEFEAGSVGELMSQINSTYIPFNPFYNGSVFMELYTVDAEGNEQFQDQFTPNVWAEYPYFLDIASCNGSAASVFIPSFAYNVYWSWTNTASFRSESFYLYEEDGERAVLCPIIDYTFGAIAENYYPCASAEYEEFELLADTSTYHTLCSSAISLTSGEHHVEENLCGPMVEVLNDCNPSPDVYRTPRWFSINSEDASALSIGLEMIGATTATTSGFGPRLAIEIYRKSPNADCDELVYVGCFADYNQVCLSVHDFEEIQANTDYFFKTLLIPTTDIRVAALLSNDGTTACGCTTPSSCAFNPAPLFNFCPNGGCTDPSACNYNSAVECDDGSCSYAEVLELELFHDENFNGSYQGFENLVGGFGIVHFELNGEIEYSVVPPSTGIIEIPLALEGDYEITFEDPQGNWQMSAPENYTIPNCNIAELGIYPTPDTFDHYGHFVGTGSAELNCNFGLDLGYWILNTGAEPLNGTISIAYNSALNVSPGGVDWSDNDGSIATWDILNHPVGEARYYTLDVAGPDVDLIGQEVEFTINVLLSDADGIPFFEDNAIATPSVTCAYDPNDKILISPSIQYNEFVAEETNALTYRVRFQNTGNAPAQNVRIVDQINLEQFDLSSFQTLSSSHPVQTNLDATGEIQFIFNNINLPDSSTNLEGSQGEVYFRIHRSPDLSPGDLFENFASIYFDNNPPIITNNSTHYLFDCDWMTLEENNASYCLESDIQFTPSLNFVEDYYWTMEGTAIGEPNMPLNYSLESDEETVFMIHMSNPFCAQNQEVYITYDELQADLNGDNNVTVSDLLSFMGEHGCIGDCPADFNENGIVDIGDLLIFLNAVGNSCP